MSSFSGNGQNLGGEDIEQLRRHNTQLQQILQLRSVILFGQILDAVNIRRQQALAGDTQARNELLEFCRAFDLDTLRAAAMGITRP